MLSLLCMNAPMGRAPTTPPIQSTMQVIFMTGKRAQLLDRVRFRRVDCDANYQPFHVTPAAVAAATATAKKGKAAKEGVPVLDDALSPPLLPQKASGFFQLLLTVLKYTGSSFLIAVLFASMIMTDSSGSCRGGGCYKACKAAA